MAKKEFDFSTMVCFLLNSTSNAMIRDYRPQLIEFDLTYPQYLVMMTLWNEDAILIKEISKETFFDSGTLTPILKRLESKNYIKRVASQEDERAKLIQLTEEGINLKEKTAHIFKDMECKIALSEEEQAQIVKICNKILVKLEVKES
ncbi:MAG: MarR family transcriptional regulator [Epsilonproteobacteria bacterium]|nr:MarR family transcriptional regulator [Campylobacterota bacterium]